MDSITISWLVATLRPYTKNPRKAYQFILSELFAVITNNEQYFVESTSSSRIMNGEYDVPANVRESIETLDERFVINKLSDYFGRIVSDSTSNKLRNEIQTKVDTLGLSNAFKRTLFSARDDYEFLSIITLCAIRTDNRADYRNVLILNGSFSMDEISGNLISLSFNKKFCLKQKISVIPVDDAFTMKVGFDNDGLPLIARDSLHGRFIERMEGLGYSSNKIKTNTHYYENNGFKIGKFVYKNTEFWLVPASHLGKRNMAESSIKLISNAVDSIVSEYDITGQGLPLYMPLIGTGRSRVFESNEMAKNFILERVAPKAPFLSGEFHLVIYKKGI